MAPTFQRNVLPPFSRRLSLVQVALKWLGGKECVLMCKVWRKSGHLSFRGLPCHWELIAPRIALFRARWELADMQMCVMGLFIWRWRYSGAVLPQEGKTFVVGDRLLPSFFWGIEDL